MDMSEGDKLLMEWKVLFLGLTLVHLTHVSLCGELIKTKSK